MLQLLTISRSNLCVSVLQYYELAYLYYTGYYALASTLLLVTLCSAVVSTAKLHKIRQELFQSVDKQRLTPLVHNGRVRSDLPRASRLHACHTCWCYCMPATFVDVVACMAVSTAAHLPQLLVLLHASHCSRLHTCHVCWCCCVYGCFKVQRQAGLVFHSSG